MNRKIKSKANKLQLAGKALTELEKIELENLAKISPTIKSSWTKIASRLHKK